MTDLIDRMRASDPAADAQGWSTSPAGDVVRDRVVPAPRRRRTWVLAVAGAVVVLALVASVALLTTATDTTPAKPVSDIQRLVRGTWRKLPPSPFGAVGRAQMFSTSRGVLVWAEYSDSGTPPGFHAALYDTGSKKWKKLAEPPVVLTTEQNAWTGRDLVFPAAGLAYNLRTDRWRSIRPAPVSFTGGALATWAPPNVMVVQPDCPLCQTFLMTDGRAGSAAYDPSTDSWTEIESTPQEIVNYAIGWSGRWVAVWGVESHSPTGAMQMLAPAAGRWRTAVGYGEPTQMVTAALVRVDDSLVWIHWDDGVVQWRQSFAPELVNSAGRALPHPSICATRAAAGPARSVVLWCASGERLQLLDVARNRWLRLPDQHTSLAPAVLWRRGSLYALTGDGGLLALR